MHTIRGTKALVTGAGSGIGRAIAVALAREGVDICLFDIDGAQLAGAVRDVESYGVKVSSSICDLTRPDEVARALDSLLASWGGLNILVNNAGVAYYGPTHQMSNEQWDRLLSVNLLTPIRLVRELLPALAAQDEAHILNICSIFGLTTMRKGAAYQTSKFGLVGFTAALRAEYGGSQIGVTALCPGFVRTAMLETFATGTADQLRHVIPAWLCATPEHVADEAVRSIRQNKGMVVVPMLARGMWRLTRLSPALVDWFTREGWRRRGRVEIAPQPKCVRPLGQDARCADDFSC
jgi:3-oxoacyl-[acyl-carrier protein] reductase